MLCPEVCTEHLSALNHIINTQSWLTLTYVGRSGVLITSFVGSEGIADLNFPCHLRPLNLLKMHFKWFVK